ncbi:MAG: acylglycerol kinase family protein [Planctomycetes bacterium]|nr:acylglycerol kinase family protein [Planctomycetota bacterium]
MKRARLLVNGRRPLAKKLALRLRGMAVNRGYDMDVVHTELESGRPNTEELGRRAALDGVELLLAAGGDGTVSDAAAGLERARFERAAAAIAEAPVRSLAELERVEDLDRRLELLRRFLDAEARLPEPPGSPALGILPLGSANVLAANLGLSRNIEKAFWELLTPGRHRLERLKTGIALSNARDPVSGAFLVRFFLIAAGAGGAVEELMADFNRPQNRGRGLWGYLASAWRVLARHEPREVEVLLSPARGGAPIAIGPRPVDFVLFNLRPRLICGKVFMPRAANPHLHAVFAWARGRASRTHDLLRLLQRLGLGRVVRRDGLTDYHEVERAEIRFAGAGVPFQYDGEIQSLAADAGPLRIVFLPLPGRLPTIRSVESRSFLRYLLTMANPFREEFHPATRSRPTLRKIVLPFFRKRSGGE